LRGCAQPPCRGLPEDKERKARPPVQLALKASLSFRYLPCRVRARVFKSVGYRIRDGSAKILAGVRCVAGVGHGLLLLRAADPASARGACLPPNGWWLLLRGRPLPDLVYRARVGVPPPQPVHQRDDPRYPDGTIRAHARSAPAGRPA